MSTLKNPLILNLIPNDIILLKNQIQISLTRQKFLKFLLQSSTIIICLILLLKKKKQSSKASNTSQRSQQDS